MISKYRKRLLAEQAEKNRRRRFIDMVRKANGGKLETWQVKLLVDMLDGKPFNPQMAKDRGFNLYMPALDESGQISLQAFNQASSKDKNDAQI